MRPLLLTWPVCVDRGNRSGKIFELVVRLWVFALCVSRPDAMAQVPALLNYQGVVSVDSLAFDGTGEFKLGLINLDGSEVYWLSSPDGDSDGEPDASVTIGVNKGLYQIVLGDTSVPNMAAIPADTFTANEVYLRVWFSDGVNGFQLLSPDQRITSVGYAMTVGDLPDGLVTTNKLSPDFATTLAALSDQVATLSDQVQQLQEGAASGLTVVSTQAEDDELIDQGFQQFYSLPEQSWRTGATSGSPAPRLGHSAVWEGESMLVWGGYLGGRSYSNSGGRYQVAANQWEPIGTFGAPSARGAHSAIWTGSEMIVWGGLGRSVHLNTGGRYSPIQRRWQATNLVGAPDVRSDHAGIWLGSSMLVWGGRNTTGPLSSGAVYDPASDQWAPLSLPDAPSGRYAASALLADDRVLIWGGIGSAGALDSGGRLLLDSEAVPQAWESLSVTDGPSARLGHSAVWTGTHMIIWGGRNGATFLEDGALYDPETDDWTALPTEGAPDARAHHSALWTGTELVLFGGENAAGPLSSGAAYDPVTEKWRPLSQGGDPLARSRSTAVWAGHEVVVFGGHFQGQPLARLQMIDPTPAWHFYRKP